MGAQVVNGLTASFWAERKPAGYKGTDLDKALKAYEPLAGKSVTIPSSLIPPVPKPKVSEIDACLAKLKNASTELDKAKTALNQVITALQAVQGAASKTSADLNKLSKGKDVDESEYKNAVATANSIATLAAGELKNYQ